MSSLTRVTLAYSRPPANDDRLWRQCRESIDGTRRYVGEQMLYHDNDRPGVAGKNDLDRALGHMELRELSPGLLEETDAHSLELCGKPHFWSKPVCTRVVDHYSYTCSRAHGEERGPQLYRKDYDATFTEGKTAPTLLTESVRFDRSPHGLDEGSLETISVNHAKDEMTWEIAVGPR